MIVLVSTYDLICLFCYSLNVPFFLFHIHSLFHAHYQRILFLSSSTLLASNANIASDLTKPPK